jgi:acetoin utilization deacetylase AcuC-like enzyme
MTWATAIPNAPQRLDAIEDRLLMTGVARRLDRREADPATLADIELAHGRMHVAALRGLSDMLREEIEAGGPTTRQARPGHLDQLSTPGMPRCVGRRRHRNAVDAVHGG